MNFYIENDIRDVGFNFESIENYNTSSSLGVRQNFNSKKYDNFIEEGFSFLSQNKLKIREISDLVQQIYLRKKSPNYTANPIESRDWGILVIDINGNITTYSPEFADTKSDEYNNFIIGNILNINKLSDIEKNPNYIKLRNIYNKRNILCKTQCKYYPLCGSAFFLTHMLNMVI